MPPPNPQCTTLQHYSIVQATFNLSSDLCMLLIPLPMVLSLNLPLKQRLVLMLVFSLGIFVVCSFPTLQAAASPSCRSHWLLDPSSNPHQGLQSLRCLRHKLHAMVHPRSFRRGICRELACDLASPQRTHQVPSQLHFLPKQQSRSSSLRGTVRTSLKIRQEPRACQPRGRRRN